MVISASENYRNGICGRAKMWDRCLSVEKARHEMRINWAVFAAFLGACAATPVTPLAVTPAYEAAVIEGVRARLKDPDSAKFGQMTAARSDKTGKIRVCGTVNARNSFGGYTGAVKFAAHVVDNGPAPVVEDAVIARGGDDVFINALCAQM